MSANKRSGYTLLSLGLAMVFLLGVFAMMDAFSVRASHGEIAQSVTSLQPSIVVTPTELQATLHPDEMGTQTLWITNTGDSPLTYTIYEMSAPVRLAGYTVQPATIPVVDIEAQAQVSAQGSAVVIIYLRERADLSPAYAIPERTARVQYVYDRLVETAALSEDLYTWLESQGTQPQRLLIANAIAATLDEVQLATVARNPHVRTIMVDHQYKIIPTITSTPVGPMLPTVTNARTETVEWNIAKIRADDVWSTFGITGEGVVVGIVDTGVTYNHPALVNSYRGNLGGGNFDHNYNWYDFVNGQPVPYDDMPHGTMGAGIISGDDGAGNQIGVAPGANWIAAKACTGGGSCSDYDLLHALEWMLAPTDLNGQNADPAKAPQVVFGGWGWWQGCDPSLEPILSVLRSAGILPIIASGGGGPNCSTMGSPADSSQVLVAGATDQNDVIAWFSSRGPVLCNPELIKPDVTAPGVDIRSSFPPNTYQVWSGMAESSAHLAGVVALIISADPTLSANDVTDILFTTSLCIEDLSCPPSEPCPEPNNVYGHGRIDAFEAVSATIGTNPPYNLPWLSEAPISGTLAAGEGVAIEATFDATGLAEGTYNGALGIVNSDPAQPFVSVPVTLSVIHPSAPVIVIDPPSLSATLPTGGMEIDTLTIGNEGDAVLTFTLEEISGTRLLIQPPLELTPYTGPVQVDEDVRVQLLAVRQTRLILFLRGQADLSAAYAIPGRAARVQYVYDRLLETAAQSDDLFNWLESQGAEPRRLLTANAIAATLNASQLETVLGFPQVGRGSINGNAYGITDSEGAVIGPPTPLAVEWNIHQIRADEAWSTFGITGQGAAVGIIDTGVIYDHPALINSYRGNLGGGNFDHNYNWFDFVNGLPVPYDPHGHGTMGAGIISGDDGAGNQIGVAPGADWIAVRACETFCTDEDLLAALQWMIAPTDLSGANPDPTKAPDIVLGMWGGGSCDGFFQTSLAALRAAGILPVFSPGASGPACFTIGSPADLPEALAAGATDSNDYIASFSSRGPSCYDEIKPDLSAPGVNIRTSNIDYGYITTSGTSWSAAHTAGAAALVISADPYLGPDATENILSDTALCIESLACGGDVCPAANNVYGNGRIDAFEAVSTTIGLHYNIPWLSEAPISGTLTPGEYVPISVTFNAAGLAEGEYHGTLRIANSDPARPFVSVPVTLTVVHQPVGPIIDFGPQSFSANLTAGGRLTDTLTISSTGDAVLTFTLYEISGTQGLMQPLLEMSMPIPETAPNTDPVQVEAGVNTELIFMGHARLILYLRGQPDLSGAYTITERASRVQYVYERLLKTAAQSDDLYNWLASQGAEPRRLLTANAIAATLDEAQLETVLGFPQVGRVGVNGRAEILEHGPATWDWLQSFTSLPGMVEWNIAQIRADEVWSAFGIRGQGAVVGVVDTGVMFTHPALNAQYRGNLGGGIYDHNYNWFDFFGAQPVPYDDNGHGTFGAGIAIGDDGLGNQIGVAPGAQWIAYKALDNGGGTYESLHAGLAWMLAPTDLSGANPDPELAPQVVLNMWGVGYSCDHTFDADLVALRAANILPVFAVGGYGPECGYVASPAADPNAFSAGATDINDEISGFSATGPSCYDGSIKPDVTAPGVNIRSSTFDGGYQGGWSGTSFSTAHLAGAAALLFSTDPNISLDQLEQTLFDTAVCLDDPMYCGGDACPGANNNYGHGRIDVYEAVAATLGMPYDIPWLVAGPLSGEIQPGQSINVPVVFDASGMQPGTYFGGIAIESNDPLAPFTTLPVTLTVFAPCQPIADLSAGFTPITPTVGQVVTFTASATGSLPITYTWDFGDGTSAIGAEVTHVYTTVGLHIVTLTAVNACDWVDMEAEVYVEAVVYRYSLPMINK